MRRALALALAGLALATPAAPAASDCEGVAVTSRGFAASQAPASAGPLHCEPAVIEAFKKAWSLSGGGHREYEAGFRVDRTPEGYTVAFAPMSYERLRLTIPILRGVTVAIAHTHPDMARPEPGPGDYDSPVPNYVVSRHALLVTVPGSKTHRRVRRSDWARPCR